MISRLSLSRAVVILPEPWWILREEVVVVIESPGRTRLYSNHRSFGSSGMILTVPGLSRTMFFFPTSSIVFFFFLGMML